MTKKPLSRGAVAGRMASIGRPILDCESALTKIYGTAIEAGLTETQAFQLLAVAYDANRGYIDNLTKTCDGLRAATMHAKADASPMHLLCWLRDKHGAGFRYLTDEQIHAEHCDNFAEWKRWSERKRILMACAEASSLPAVRDAATIRYFAVRDPMASAHTSRARMAQLAFG